MLTVGAQELIEEVAAPDGKLSGEEDRYSGTDLYDFQANVEGSEALVELLAPALEEADPELLATIREQFATLYDHLAELGTLRGRLRALQRGDAGAEGPAGRRPRRPGRVALPAQRHARLGVTTDAGDRGTSRRSFLAGTALAGAGVLAAGCSDTDDGADGRGPADTTAAAQPLRAADVVPFRVDRQAGVIAAASAGRRGRRRSTSASPIAPRSST